ncbi:hypothetical protein [Flavobacterium cerinum]|uniref:hypothetical protein n=1 Tax=Flavobacterium cerinum TaxID=2502784 RepID=UPI0013E2AC6D|nr:hypothetical protein [Flavobacterium cerinum]
MSKTTNKVNRKQLAHILGIGEKTARKEYKIIIDSLGIKRNYLTFNDLQKYGI